MSVVSPTVGNLVISVCVHIFVGTGVDEVSLLQAQVVLSIWLIPMESIT